MSGWSNDQLQTITLPPGASSTDARIVIGPNVPAELNAYYAPFFETVVAAILFYSSAFDYCYFAQLDTPAGLAIGTRDSLGGVQEAILIFQNSGHPRIEIGDIAAVDLVSAGAAWGPISSFDGAGTAQETWHNVSYSNGWANQASFATMQYRLVASPPNSVQIVGAASGGTSVDGTTIFTLPAGYRPSATLIWPVSPAGRVTLDSTGAVKCAGFTAGAFCQFAVVVPLDK